MVKGNKSVFCEGMRDGIPIGLGYFAVAFSLGIAAQHSGLTAFQSMIASFLCNASAGEYAGFTLVGANAAYFEMALMTFVANARYLLMSCAMSQKFSSETSMIHRILVGFGLTDELFGIAVSKPGHINPYYSYGAFLIASPCWAFGTALGAVAGNILPMRIVSALSVALFGMFLAIIMPPARKSKIIAGIVIASFVLSYTVSVLPVISELSEGIRTIILTVLISSVAAILFPHNDTEGENN